MDELSAKEKETLSALLAKAETTDIIELLIQNGYQVSATGGEKHIEFQEEKKECVVICLEEGEWEALYINGELATADHTLSTSDMMEAIGIPSYHFQDIQIKTVSSDGEKWWDENYGGGTPDRLEEIPSNFLE